jgi:hypothetical protein
MVNTVVQEIESTLRKSEQAVLDAIRGWAQTVRDNAPQAPVRVPFADRLPTPKAVVSSAYDVVETPLAGQRRFAESVLEALDPAKEEGHAEEEDAA